MKTKKKVTHVLRLGDIHNTTIYTVKDKRSHNSIKKRYLNLIENPVIGKYGKGDFVLYDALNGYGTFKAPSYNPYNY